MILVIDLLQQLSSLPVVFFFPVSMTLSDILPNYCSFEPVTDGIFFVEWSLSFERSSVEQLLSYMSGKSGICSCCACTTSF